MTSARATILLLVVAATLCCRSSRRDEPLVGPVALSTPQHQLGQRVFMTHCYQCHPGGDAGLAPAINSKPLPGALIRTQVRHGLGEMPGFGADRIPDPDLDALVLYVNALDRTR